MDRYSLVWGGDRGSERDVLVPTMLFGGVAVLDVADLCRAAFLELLTLEGASRDDVEVWVLYTYAPVLGAIGNGALGRDLGALVASIPAEPGAFVARLRFAVLRTLQLLSGWRGAPIDRAETQRHTTIVGDMYGGVGYAPSSKGDLIERCVALVFADFLTRPRDYVTELRVDGGRATFDSGATETRTKSDVQRTAPSARGRDAGGVDTDAA